MPKTNACVNGLKFNAESIINTDFLYICMCRLINGNQP